MDFSPITCKICKKEHTVFAENTDNLWKKLCMLCRHEIRRTNQFLAQLEKSSAFFISTARIIESAVKTEPEEEMGRRNVRLWIDSDKIILGPEPPGAAPFIEDSYRFCGQNFARVDIKIEDSNKVNLEPKSPGASQFIEDNYNFCGKNSPPMEIEYVGVDEDVSNVDSCSSGNIFTAHDFKSDENQEEMNQAEPSDRKLFLPEYQEFSYTQLENSMFKCNICGVTQKTKRLREHIRTHTGEKPYRCETCRTPFLKKSGLTRHMILHTGERPFECSACSKTFNNSLSLKRHMLTHTGEKPYKCHTCAKEFSGKGNLKVHMKVHSDERPYECENCSKKFKDYRDLRRHMYIHTGERPFKCSICTKGFIIKSLLRSHMKIHSLDNSSK